MGGEAEADSVTEPSFPIDDEPLPAPPASPSPDIALTPLAGSQTSTCRFLSHLLEFDDAKILLDCGINDRREDYLSRDDAAHVDAQRKAYLQRLTDLAPHLTLVLLSAPTVEALGLLPYLVCKLKLSCPIYATFPCRDLGQLTVLEWISSRSMDEAHKLDRTDITTTVTAAASPVISDSKEADENMAEATDANTNAHKPQRADDVAWRVSREEVQTAFSRIEAVVYSQIVRLSGRSNSPFSLLAHPAGTTLGSTLWSLRSATTDSLLYAPAFNHASERTMDLAAFLVKGKNNLTEVNGAMRHVGSLIIGAERSKMTSTKSKARDAKLLDIITTNLNNQQSVLMPTDSIARFMELIVLLELHWGFSGLSQLGYQLCFLSSHADDILSTLRGMSEQMGGHLGSNENERSRILRLQNVRILSSIEQLHTRYPPEQPKLVVCAPSSLSFGLSRQLVVSSFLQSPNALILLTSPGPPGSLSHYLFRLWNSQQAAGCRYGEGVVGEIIDLGQQSAGVAITATPHIRLQNRRKVTLQGDELMKYIEDTRLAKEREQKAKAMAERNRRMMEADDADGSSDSEDSDDDAGEAQGDSTERTVVPLSETGLGSSSRRPFSGAETDGIVPSAGPWDEFVDDFRGSIVGGFDIYVRPSYNPAYKAEKPNNRLASNRARMFPFYERRRRIDGYGEAIDVEGWQSRGKAMAEIETILAAATKTQGNKRKRTDVDQLEQPHKFVSEDLLLDLRCKIIVVDMEGKADGRALRHIVSLVEPKKVVLINAEPDATEAMAQALKSLNLDENDVLKPHIGERARISTITKSFSVKLDDDLMSVLALRKIDEFEVVPVRGIIGESDEGAMPKLVPSSTFDITTETSADQAAADEDEESSGRLPDLLPPHFIGDIKLVMLKGALTAKDIPVVFRKGMLLCGPIKAAAVPKAKEAKVGRLAQLTGVTSRPSPTPELGDDEMDSSGGRVIVRKVRDELVLEGTPGDTYYAIRRAIYAMHAVGS